MLALAQTIRAEPPKFAIHLFIGASALFVAAFAHHNLTRTTRSVGTLPAFASMPPDSKFEARANGTLAFDTGRALHFLPQPPSTFSFAADMAGVPFPTSPMRIARAKPAEPETPVAARPRPAPPVAPLPPKRDVDLAQWIGSDLFGRGYAPATGDAASNQQTAALRPLTPVANTRRPDLLQRDTTLRPPKPIPARTQQRQRDNGFSIGPISPAALVNSSVSALREVGQSSGRLFTQLFN